MHCPTRGNVLKPSSPCFVSSEAGLQLPAEELLFPRPSLGSWGGRSSAREDVHPAFSPCPCSVGPEGVPSLLSWHCPSLEWVM